MSAQLPEIDTLLVPSFKSSLHWPQGPGLHLYSFGTFIQHNLPRQYQMGLAYFCCQWASLERLHAVDGCISPLQMIILLTTLQWYSISFVHYHGSSVFFTQAQRLIKLLSNGEGLLHRPFLSHYLQWFISLFNTRFIEYLEVRLYFNEKKVSSSLFISLHDLCFLWMVLDIIWCRLWCSYCHWIPELWIDNHWQITKFSNSCLVFFVSSLYTKKRSEN